MHRQITRRSDKGTICRALWQKRLNEAGIWSADFGPLNGLANGDDGICLSKYARSCALGADGMIGRPLTPASAISPHAWGWRDVAADLPGHNRRRRSALFRAVVTEPFICAVLWATVPKPVSSRRSLPNAAFGGRFALASAYPKLSLIVF